MKASINQPLPRLNHNECMRAAIREKWEAINTTDLAGSLAGMLNWVQAVLTACGGHPKYSSNFQLVFLLFIIICFHFIYSTLFFIYLFSFYLLYVIFYLFIINFICSLLLIYFIYLSLFYIILLEYWNYFYKEIWIHLEILWLLHFSFFFICHLKLFSC